MSTGVPQNPVCENISSADIAVPPVKNAVAVAFDPVCRQWTGTQTATPDVA